MIESEFTRQSCQIVENFLNSVVIIDDHAALDPPIEPLNSESEAEISVPPQRPTIENTVDQPEESSDEAPSETAEEEMDKPEVIEGLFNAKEIIESFAAKGIICAALGPKAPEDLENLLETIPKLAVRADILIFDYSFGDGGTYTRRFIKNLVYHDKENRDRLRLIIIYTIDNKILDILKAIKQEVEVLPNAPAITEKLEEYSLQIGYTKIVVLLKQDADVPEEAKELLQRKVSFSNLVDHAIYEFTEMTNGLVPNVALQSMAEIRKNTSRILRHYNRNLDVPYLAHRALLDDPIDAEGHIIELFSADLLSLLEETDVKKYVDIKRITDWLQLQELAGVKFLFTKRNGDEIQLTTAKVIKILTNGISNTDLGLRGNDEKRQKNNPKEIVLSQIFSGKKPPTTSDEELFANISAFKTFFGDLKPILKLGTVIQDNENQYLVCIQPICDCVRIDNPTQFLFLPLEERTETPFDLVIKNNETYIKARIKKKVVSLKSIIFKGDANRLVKAIQEGEYFYFTAEPTDTTEAQEKYKWIGELRLERSISMSNSFAAELARVGFTESEWLRRHAKKQ